MAYRILLYAKFYVRASIVIIMRILYVPNNTPKAQIQNTHGVPNSKYEIKANTTLAVIAVAVAAEGAQLPKAHVALEDDGHMD